MSEEALSSEQRTLYWLVSVALVFLAGIFSGLTLGLFSIDTMYLRVIARTGSPKEQLRAEKILPLLERQHLTLVTLLVSNAAAMTALPIFLERLLNPVMALVISVTAVLAFGEVIPQATFVRNAIPVGAFFAPFIWFMIACTFVVSWPISKLLDCIVGSKVAIMQKDQLGEFLRLHGEEHPDEISKLSGCEVKLMRGAMSLSTKTVKEIMKVRNNQIFMLSSVTPLDQANVEKILLSGFSRIPIFKDGDMLHILGILLVKSLLPLAYTNPSPPPLAGEYHLREVLRVAEDTIVNDIYQAFQSGTTHMAAVYNRRGTLTGIITLEEVFEELHSINITDEMDLQQKHPAQIELRQRQLIELFENVKKPGLKQPVRP